MFYYVVNIRFILKNVFVIDIFVLIFICFEFLSFSTIWFLKCFKFIMVNRDFISIGYTYNETFD